MTDVLDHRETNSGGLDLSQLPDPASVSELADALRVSKMTIYRLIHGGKLRAMRVGRTFRVSAADMTKYLEKRESAPRSYDAR